MVVYFAMEIENGGLDYKTVFSIQKYVQFQAGVDAILAADGKQDLIVSLT